MTIKRLIWNLFFPLMLLPQLAHAACSGEDLRLRLSTQERSQIAAQMQKTPFSEGNHWIARKGEREIHLIGTMHISTPQLVPLVSRLQPVITASDVLFLESTPAEIAAMRDTLVEQPELTFITDGPTLIDRLPPPDWAILAKKARQAGIPPWVAAKMRPWFLATALSLPPCLRQDPDVENGLDKRLAAVAARSDVPQTSLENPLDVIRLLDKDPLDVQLRQMQPHIALIGGGEDGENGIATMMAAYFEERVPEYLEITRREFLKGASVPPSEAKQMWNTFMFDLLAHRNSAWMPVIEASEANRIVIAVGALHLSGEFGLLQLLSDRGYALQRAAF